MGKGESVIGSSRDERNDETLCERTGECLKLERKKY